MNLKITPADVAPLFKPPLPPQVVYGYWVLAVILGLVVLFGVDVIALFHSVVPMFGLSVTANI